VLDPGNPFALEPGDVLVAPITDPAWTPLFVTAAAVVVDVGAQVSHAVIVSRELGIPCVVSVKDASRRIPDGAVVTVDGTTGTVTVH
jgi:pyruvate,water dikinase